jgi:hypothetical protein
MAITLMVGAAALRLSNEFPRLVFEKGHSGAIDLIELREQVRLLFAGQPLYRLRPAAVYPPAACVVLWPFLGWTSVAEARWLWAATTGLALVVLISLLVGASSASTRLEKLFIAATPLAVYSTSATMGNGQLGVHLLTALTAALVLLSAARRRLPADACAAALYAAALIKPSLTAPFFVLLLLPHTAVRPAALIVALYAAITWFATQFQEAGFVGSLLDWMQLSMQATDQQGSYANLHSWLAAWGAQSWSGVASLLVLASFAVWTYRHRHADLWVAAGVGALVSRLWTYHRLYDDVLVLLPMIALFRIAKHADSSDAARVRAGCALAILWAASLAPARLLVAAPPWPSLFAAGQTITWLTALTVLLIEARQPATVC